MSGVHLKIEGLSKVYKKGTGDVRVLHEVNLDVKPGEAIALTGASGSGKSSLLHVLGLLDLPTSGRVLLDGVDCAKLSDGAQARLRNRKVGFVFQSHNLLPEHTALGNAMLPILLAGGSETVAKARATALLRAVGLSGRMDHVPGELSGGEQQRVALARALVMGPGLVLADEPTGNLDPSTALGVFDLMMRLHAQLGSTLVVVTHAMDIAKLFPRVLHLQDGRITEA